MDNIEKARSRLIEYIGRTGQSQAAIFKELVYHLLQYHSLLVIHTAVITKKFP